MAQTRFTCTLTRADEPGCKSYARVTIMDSEGAAARGCPGTPSPRSTVSPAPMWTGSTPRSNEWERKALELSEERSQLAVVRR